MREKVKLDFDQEGYVSLENFVKETGGFLLSAKTVLENLEVNCNAKDLLDGEFVAKFHEHHKKAHENEKDGFAKRLRYEKYIEMLELDITKLMELEADYKFRINKTYDFFKHNNSFYRHCEIHAPRNSFLKGFLDEAPSKVSLLIKELFKISRNKVIVNIDRDLFTLYTTNNRQIKIINDLLLLVDICKRLGKTSKEIKPLIKSYLVDDSNFNSSKVALSEDLETINFNYNKILTIK